MSVKSNTPILFGVGQIVSHWDGADIRTAPDPIALCVEASRDALDDTGDAARVTAAIDTLAVVRTAQDSGGGYNAPFGRCENPPSTVAAGLGATPRRLIYSAVGGDQPQALVDEFAEDIFAGRSEVILLTGAEATAAMKLASRKGLKLDWSHSADGDMEDRGIGKPLLSAYEIANGFGYPTQTYSIFEHALRTRLGLGRDAYRTLISELFADFSTVAAANPYAQFPIARDAAFLETPSDENYDICDPYLKWHVAQDAVNQGAALVLTSVGKAEALGIDPNKWVFLHGYARAVDRFPTERQDLSRSRAMELALERAMAATRLRTDHIKYFDLYSCFPCAVLIAAEALGLDWRKTTPTVTGGLPFFGGAGNNYSMHAIASMADRLRADPGRYGLVLANGGYLSKEAVGIYSTTPPTDWNPISSADLQGALDATPAQQVLNADTEATIESFTVTFAKGRPQHACIAAKTPEGRVLARAHNDHLATIASLTTDEPIGKTVRIVHDGGKNYFEPVDHIGAHASTGALARKLAHVTVQRDGHVLEVTLNRPERLNALQSETSFELHEIWDAFEQDSELWVAIITGAGDRAFSSGNDLKVTAKGAEMLLPQSGFAGLCSRFNREKPVIAAVNGLAMGGGLEIVLACDLAVADDRAKFALPEVKVGLFAGAGGVQGLTRQIGRKVAMELILTGRHIGAAEAYALGIVNSVVPAGTALPEARRLAQALLANSPSAIRACRQALNALDRIEGLQEARDQSNAVLDRLLRTRDFREGVTAFAEKRLPNWSNS